MAGGSKRSSGHPGSGPPPMTHRDLFHRVNFTLQASAYLQHLQRPDPRRRSDINEPGSAASGPSRDSQSPTPTLEVVVDRKGKRRAVEVDTRSKRKRDDVEAGPDFGRLAREDMKSTRGMAVHNLLKLCETDPSDIGLDGPLRRRRREKAAKRGKVPFHEREAAAAAATTVPARGGKVEAHPHRAGGAGAQANQKNKGPKGGGVMSDGVERGKGHSLWRGGERVEGWGIRLVPDIQEVGS
ncbi:hypothetical protein JCM24511_00160 [Saitozyma sp. JCM 24511]|nr:hypothetical protein JCM24511_00160 [Saitozyma sp. JCM 24511]